jgi:hypothetical protein
MQGSQAWPAGQCNPTELAVTLLRALICKIVGLGHRPAVGLRGYGGYRVFTANSYDLGVCGLATWKEG